jgi:TonB family protein
MNDCHPHARIAALVLGLSLSGALSSIASGSASTQTTSVPDESIVRTPVKLDPLRPPKIGEQFYPRDSLRHHEQGKCVVRMEIGGNGDVLAEQLLISTGFPLLDSACVVAFLDGHFIPATLNGKPIVSWINIPTIWKIDSTNFPDHKDFSDTPKVADDYQLEIGADHFPPAALGKKAQGNCIVRTLITQNGIAVEVKLTKSTGNADLDAACIQAINRARFTPALKDGVPNAAAIDLVLDWKLPPSN